MPRISDSLGNLALLRDHRNARASSFDTTGANADFWVINAGEKKTIADLEGPGIVKHIWVTIRSEEPAYLRRIVLRMFWDDETEPSIETPVGDFFGLGHATTTYFVSQPLSMFDRGFNCFFPMPFYKKARIEVESKVGEGSSVTLDLMLAQLERGRDGQNPAD